MKNLFIITAIIIVCVAPAKSQFFYDDCTCDVVITPYPIPRPPSNPTYLRSGNLDKFYEEIDGECYRSVDVRIRRMKDQQSFTFKEDKFILNINQVLDIHSNKTICLSGEFFFTETIFAGRQTIKLRNSLINYEGDGLSPGISIDDRNVTIDGSGSSVITTNVPMTEGLIALNAIGVAPSKAPQVIFTQIQGLELNSTSNYEWGSQSSPGKGAIEDRAIVLYNTNEGIAGPRDVGTNYHTNISDLKINDFTTAIHLRGQSNANHINGIELTGIKKYGIWLSGCFDNTISNVTFKNCLEATAVRLDNDVVDHIADPNGWFPNTDDPNRKFEIGFESTVRQILNSLQLSNITNPTQAQNVFNQQLTDFIGDINDPLFGPQRLMIEDYCTIENVYNDDDELLQVGLKGLSNSNLVRYDNTSADYNDITILDFLHPGIWNLFEKQNYRNSTNDIIEIPAACKDRFNNSITDFFIRPAINSLTRIKIFDEEDQNQVLHGVEVYDRYDDGLLCEDDNLVNNSMNPLPPINCVISSNDCFDYYGIRNAIYFCPPANSNLHPINSLRESRINPNALFECEWVDRGLHVKYHN